MESSLKIKQLEEEIETLREELKKLHFAKSSEQDYDIKSKIIDKQNEMIEMLIKERDSK
jgi:hypothetical protein